MKHLSGLLINICRAFPPDTPSRPNSFAVIDRFADVDAPNVNSSLIDGEKSNYWGRAWEQSGGDPAMIKDESSIVFIRQLAHEIKKGTYTQCASLMLGISTLIDCEGCNDGRSWHEIEADNAITIQRIVNEFEGIRYHNVSWPGSTDIYTIPLTVAQAEQLRNEAYFISSEIQPCNVGNGAIQKITTDGQIRHSVYGTKAAIVSTVNLTVCFCLSHIPLEYSIIDFDKYATTKCETC